MIHVRLEGGRGVTEAEKHDDGFVESGGCDECCFPAVIRMDKDIVVSPSDIDLSKISCEAEFIEKRGNQRKRVGILDRFGIEGAVILTWAEFAVLFSHEKESTSLWRFGRYDGSSGEMFFDKFFHGELFGRGELISFDTFWFEIRFEFDAMVKLPTRRGNGLGSFFRENISKKVMEIRGNDLFRGFCGSFKIFF